MTTIATANAVSCDVIDPSVINGWRLTQEEIDRSVDWDNDWLWEPGVGDWCAFERLEDGEVYVVSVEEQHTGHIHWSEPGAQTRRVAHIVGRWDAERECIVSVPEPLRSELNDFVDKEFSPKPQEPYLDDDDDY